MNKISSELLVRLAKNLIRSRYEKKGHHSFVAAVLLTKNGNVYQALNVGTYQLLFPPVLKLWLLVLPIQPSLIWKLTQLWRSEM